MNNRVPKKSGKEEAKVAAGRKQNSKSPVPRPLSNEATISAPAEMQRGRGKADRSRSSNKRASPSNDKKGKPIESGKKKVSAGRSNKSSHNVSEPPAQMKPLKAATKSPMKAGPKKTQRGKTPAQDVEMEEEQKTLKKGTKRTPSKKLSIGRPQSGMSKYMIDSLFLLGRTEEKKPAKGKKALSKTAEKSPKKEEPDVMRPPKVVPAYFFFSNEVIPKIREENQCKQLEAAKICGERWNALTEEQKAPYIKKNEADR